MKVATRLVNSRWLCGLALLVAMLAWPALAQDFERMAPKERHETLKNMTPEQREEFKKARQEKWNAMSDNEKVKLIEERRSQYLKEREEEWNRMSDREKIERAEKRMQKKHQQKPMHSGAPKQGQ